MDEQPNHVPGRRLTPKEAIELEGEAQRILKAEFEKKHQKEADYWRNVYGTDDIERLEKALYSVKNWAEQILGIAQRIRDDNDVAQIHKIVAQSRQIILEANQAVGNATATPQPPASAPAADAEGA